MHQTAVAVTSIILQFSTPGEGATSSNASTAHRIRLLGDAVAPNMPDAVRLREQRLHVRIPILTSARNSGVPAARARTRVGKYLSIMSQLGNADTRKEGR